MNTIRKQLIGLIVLGVILLPHPALAARLWMSGFELNSATDGVEFTSNSAPVAISTTNVRSGTYAGRITAGAGFWRQVVATSNQTTVGYISVCVYVVAAPNATTQFVRWSTTGNVSQGNISMLTNRTLVLLKTDGTQIGSASAAVALNTWTCVELANDASTSPGTLTGRIQQDGAGSWTTFATGNNSNQGAWARALIGNVTGAQTTNDMYFDDWKVNDSSGSNQTSFPDNGKIIALRPSAAGDSNGFLTQVGGTAGAANNFTRVNEVTPDDATSYNGSAVLSAEDLFNMDNSGLQTYDTINVVAMGVRMADLVSADATAAFKIELEKTGSGTKSQSGTLIPNSTTWLTNAATDPKNYPLVTYTDPDGAAWTSTTLDSMQTGYIQTATNVQTIAVSTAWTYVDYTPGTAPTPTPNTGYKGNILNEDE